MSAFSRETFVELMNFVMRSVEFSFNNIMYKQVDGLAMGSPLGHVLANIFVGYYEQKLMSALTDNKPSYLKYVDDTYAIFENEEACQRFYVSLNSDNGFLSQMYRKPPLQVSMLGGTQLVLRNTRLIISSISCTGLSLFARHVIWTRKLLG